MQTVRFFVLLALLGSIGILGADVYHSTAAGGSWSAWSTWGDEITIPIPDADDDVFIIGPVTVAGAVACHNLTVDGSGAELRNGYDEYGTVNIGGNLALLNDGKILCDTYQNRHITVNLAGNFSQAGLCQPQTFNFTGSPGHHLAQSPGYSLAPYLNITVPAGATLYIDTDFAVSSSHASDNANFNWSSTTSNYNLVLAESADLAFTNVILQRANISGDGTNDLLWNNSRNGYMYYCALSDLAIQGEISFRAGCSLTDAVNHGILQNADNTSTALSISGDFANYGTLRNHPDVFLLTVNVDGTIQNDGIWAAQTTNISSASAQSIHFPQDHPCQSVNFIDTNSASTILAVGDLWFQNCSLDLNLATLVLDSAPSGLHIITGNLRDATIQSVAGNVIDMSEGTITNVAFQSITNAGTLTLASDITVAGDLVNNGYIQNYPESSRNLTVQGNITNTGSIGDNPSNFRLTLNCWGDIVQSGLFNCYRVYINGPGNQTINRGGSLAPDLFYLDAGFYVNQWFLNGSLSSYTGTQISIPITSDDVLGTWQPYYSVTDTWGRTITIQAAGLPAIPQNVWLEPIQSGAALLHWNEALNASSYGIYVSDDPYGGFTLQWDHIIDPNPGDGTVEFTISTADARKFYRIVARN